MSYSIIFDTKFIKLSDGRILHLDRSGCNNDTEGRHLSDYIGKIYTYKELQEYVISFTKDGKSEESEIKLGSKWATYWDYGKQLALRANKAKTYDEFIAERDFTADRFDGINLYKPEQKTLTPEEFDECFYDYLYGDKPFSYSRIMTKLNSEAEIINTINDDKGINFYVGKKYKKIA